MPEDPGDHPRTTPSSPSVESDDLKTNHESAILAEDLSDGQTEIMEEVNSDINEPNGIQVAQGASGVSPQQKTLSKSKTKKRKQSSPTGKTPPGKKDNQSKTVKLLNNLIESVNGMGTCLQQSQTPLNNFSN